MIQNIAEKVGNLRQRLIKYRAKKYRLSVKQQTFLFRQLSYLITNGYSMERALYQLLGNKEPKKPQRRTEWQKAIERMIEVLQDTGSLTLAIESLGIFEPSTIYRVESGEMNGQLEDVLLEVGKRFEVESNIRRSILGMMIYPLFVSLIFLAVIYFISAKIMPPMIAMFEELRAEITGLTKAVIAVSSFVVSWGGQSLIIVGCLVVGFRLLLRVPRVRFVYDRVLIKIPYVSKLIRMQDLIRYSNVFYALFDAGVTLETSLECAAKTVKNLYLKKQSLYAKSLVIEHGLELAEALLASELFDDTEINLIDTALATDRVCEVFKIIIEHATKELEAVVKVMLSLMEPITILALGIMVGVFVIGVYVPMMSIYNSM